MPRIIVFVIGGLDCLRADLLLTDEFPEPLDGVNVSDIAGTSCGVAGQTNGLVQRIPCQRVRHQD